MNNGFSKILILVIVVVIAAGGVLVWQYWPAPEKTGCDWRPTKDYGPCEMIIGVYYNGEECGWISGCDSKGEEIPFTLIEDCEAECATDETANWQTYRNEEYGFEVKYPDDYEISVKRGTDILPAIVSSDASIVFDVYNNFSSLPLEEWLRSGLVVRDVSINWTKILVNGIEGLKSPTLGNAEGGLGYTVFIAHNEKIYLLRFDNPGSEEGLSTFDSILSTFRFID